MIVDILMAFATALFLEMLALTNKRFKQFIILIICLAIIFIYFISGYQLNFIGEIDLAIWIMFVIIFDMVLMFTIRKILKTKTIKKE